MFVTCAHWQKTFVVFHNHWGRIFRPGPQTAPNGEVLSNMVNCRVVVCSSTLHIINLATLRTRCRGQVHDGAISAQVT
eukprot:4415430-Amphidinium_carterae.1